jgi:quercetin dioxygenase-like cupin family protein
MMEMLKWGVAAMLLTLFATAQASADGPVEPYQSDPRSSSIFKHLLPGIALAILVLAPFLAQGAPSSKDTVVFDHVLPNVPGKSMRGVLVEYPPGGTTAAHTHPHSAFIYATVLEGAIRSQVNDGPITVYTAGQNFAELPGDHHRVSENASATQPARLLAVFVVDTAETNLVIDDAH